MNRTIHRTSIGLLVVAFIAAVAEIDFRIIIGLVATGFVTMVANGVSAGIADNDRYRAALMAHAGGSDPAIAGASGNSPFTGLIVLVVFAALSGLTIAFDNPVIIGGGVALTFAIGIPWQLRRGRAREKIWGQFAKNHNLEFTPGDLWNRHQNGRISGEFLGRAIRLEIVWQDKATAGASSRTEVLVAQAAVDSSAKFCVDDLNVAGPNGAWVRRLLESPDFRDRIEATTPNRISLFEGSLLCFFLRVPRTTVELSFQATLVTDMAAELEGSV